MLREKIILTNKQYQYLKEKRKSHFLGKSQNSEKTILQMVHSVIQFLQNRNLFILLILIDVTQMAGQVYFYIIFYQGF